MDWIFSILFSVPYLPWILLGLVALVLYQRLGHRLSVRVPVGPSVSGDDILGKLLGRRYAEAKLEKAVRREKKLGNWLAAGRYYEEGGKPQQAVDAFLEGQEFFAAASVLEKMGKQERAAELYLQSGDFKKAAQMFQHAGKPARAAALFLEKGNTLEAARLYGLAGEWGKAGDLYSRSGYPLRAAEAFEKKGEFLKAAEAYEKHFMENVSFSTTYSSTSQSPDQKSALLAGRLFEKAGELGRAHQIYVKGSYFLEAGRSLEALGQPARAAEYYMRAEEPEAAAQAYEQAGDRVKAANLRGEVALRQERVPDAARHFQEGQDYLRAAELFESVGLLGEAAGAYEAGESWVAAANVYVRAGLKDRAAAAFERGADFENAARFYEESGQAAKATELYDRAGLTFKSGEAAARAGDRDQAIALLQRVAPTDENYRGATELLAQLFIEAGRPALAIERVHKAIGEQPVSSANLDLFYWLGAAHEANGNGSLALDLYKKVQAEDLRFRDVEARVARLVGEGVVAPQAGSAPAAAAAPAASASRAALPARAAGSGAAAAGFPGAGTAAEAQAATAASHPATSAEAHATAPARGSRFVAKEELGRGPLGTVYRAEDQVDGRNVALRIVPPQLLQADGLLQALVKDLKAAAQLSHPNVVKVLGFVELGGQRCVVTEYVSGRNFSEALRAGHKMSFKQAHSLGRVLAQVLAFIHGKGLVHGSIQPSNVMVSQGVVKVADLGLSRLSSALRRELDYRAPEAQADVSGDVYATAAVLYHLLTGTHPRSQPQGVALPLPSTLAAGIPEAFDKTLIRALQPRVELRHASADEFLADLKGMIHIG
jgi:serine/threonine-protein kinase